MKQNQVKERNSTIELLRLFLMFSVVILHLCGSQIRNIYDSKSLFYIELCIIAFTTMSVNAFVFISGYYSISFKIKSLIKLVVQTLFYSIGIFIVSILFLGNPLSIKEAVFSLLPVSSAVWWFISCYIGVYIFSPIINIAFEKLSKRQIQITLLGLLFLNCFSSFLFDNRSLGANGYSFFSLVTIYCVARYMKIYDLNLKHPLLIFILSSFSTFFINAAACYFSPSLIFPASRYNNPLIVIAAISIFFVFLKMKPFYSKKLNIIASYALAVYLIHNHPFVFRKITTITAYINSFDNNFIVVGSLLLFGILIFTACLVIEHFRVILSKPLFNYIDKRIKES